MLLQQLISTYGYAAIGIGTFVEGETILVLGGFAAHRGYLDLPWVIVFAFLGTLFSDQLYFHIGRLKGKSLIENRPLWKAKSDKLMKLLYQHQIWLIIGFRFIYGMRTVTPFLLGASNVSPLRFLIFNMLGAFLWSICFAILGYLFGGALEIMLGDIKKYELFIFIALAVIGSALWFVHFRRDRNVKKHLTSLDDGD